MTGFRNEGCSVKIVGKNKCAHIQGCLENTLVAEPMSKVQPEGKTNWS